MGWTPWGSPLQSMGPCTTSTPASFKWLTAGKSGNSPPLVWWRHSPRGPVSGAVMALGGRLGHALLVWPRLEAPPILSLACWLSRFAICHNLAVSAMLSWHRNSCMHLSGVLQLTSLIHCKIYSERSVYKQNRLSQCSQRCIWLY